MSDKETIEKYRRAIRLKGHQPRDDKDDNDDTRLAELDAQLRKIQEGASGRDD